MHFKFLVLLFCFCISFCYAAIPDHKGLETINAYQKDGQIFDEEKLKELKTDEDYDYTENIESSDWWTEFKEWVWMQIQKLFGDDVDPNSLLWQFIRLLPYIVPAIAVMIIIWYIVKTNPGSQVMRQHNKSKVILTEEEELLMERDLDQLAEDAITNKQWRLAVRFLYLNCIKRLDMKRMIRYANEKTNYEYIKEIQHPGVAQPFKSLTLAYEQIWYGQMVFDEGFFLKYKTKYDQFHSLLDQKQYAKA